MGYVLGIDTSCYTTSLGVINENNELVYQDKKLLKVEEGQRGLQQSAGVFQHLINLPLMIETLFANIPQDKISIIGVSSRPRPIDDSYMPVFKVGEGFGQALSSALKVPLVKSSHQEGHIMAGVWSAGGPREEKFLAVHLSGGTTELLLVQKKISRNNIFQAELLGGTVDIHAGQFIDRIGVALGLNFPAGPQIEVLAENSSKELIIPSSVNGYNLSLSGPEAAGLRLIQQGEDKVNIARALEKCIATSLEKVIRKAVIENEIKEVLLVGGVAANSYLRKRLCHRLEHNAVGCKLYFAEPRFSTDNAVGTALITNLINVNFHQN